MNLSYSAIWDDVVALLKSHASLVATVAGVFLFLPNLLIAYAAPQPQAPDVAEMLRLWGEYLNANWPWLLLGRLFNMVGEITILLLIFSRGISVGGAIAAAMALLLPYFAASILGNFAVGAGLVLLLVPGFYLLGRLGPLGSVLVAEAHRNPIAALRRCWALTSGHGWSILALILIVAIAAAIVVGIVTTLFGILFVLVAGQETGQFLVLIVRTAGNAAMMTLLLVLGAAIYRRLSESGQAPSPPTKGI